jgi:hypothetical protein
MKLAKIIICSPLLDFKFNHFCQGDGQNIFSCRNKKSIIDILFTVIAVDFETPVGSSTFFSFFSWAASAEVNNE